MKIMRVKITMRGFLLHLYCIAVTIKPLKLISLVDVMWYNGIHLLRQLNSFQQTGKNVQRISSEVESHGMELKIGKTQKRQRTLRQRRNMECKQGDKEKSELEGR